jgi:hypothetical protein
MRRAMALIYRPLDVPLAEERVRQLARFEDADLAQDQRPGEAGFKLQDEEALTANDGAFEVEVTSSCAAVATADGRTQMFQWPNSPPGSRTDGVEFRLLPQLLLSLTLTEASGRPLAPAKSFFGPRVYAVTDRGEEASAEIQQGPPGRFGARWYRLAGDRVVGLVVEAAGYERLRREWRPPAAGHDSLALELTPRVKHVVKLRLKLHDPKELGAVKKRNFQLEACLLPPDRRLSKSEGSFKRCGLDADQGLTARAAMEVDLEVANGREWQIYVNGPFAADSEKFETIHVGAFHPGPERHEVELPPVSAAWVDAQKREAEAQAARANEAAPRSDRQHGFVLVKAVDAVTNAALENAEVRSRIGGDENGWFSQYDGTQDGSSRRMVVAGRSVLRINAPEHHTSADIDYSVEPGATIDLGTVRLEPLPHYRLKLVARDGSGLSGSYTVRTYAEGAVRNRFGGADSYGVAIGPGLFELRSELPDRFIVAIATTPEEGGRVAETGWSQRFEVDRWSVDETREFALARWHPVTIVVDLSGVPEDLWRASFWLGVNRERAPAVDRFEDRYSSSSESRDTDAGERRYRFLLPSDRYVVRGACGLFAIPDTPLELTDEQDDVAVTIAAR